VARTAGVSIDFLYANDDLRRRIEKLRSQQARTIASRAAEPPAAEQDDIVHILTVKLRQERDPGAPPPASSRDSSLPHTANCSASCTRTASLRISAAPASPDREYFPREQVRERGDYRTS
jgi:hypothetical protein